MSEIISKPLGKELMLYDSKTDAVHVLNPTAKLIYQLHREGNEIDRIKDAVVEQFTVDDGIDVEIDIRRTLSELTEKGLL